MRICVGEAIQADQGDVSRDGLPFGAFANWGILQPERDVLPNRRPGK